ATLHASGRSSTRCALAAAALAASAMLSGCAGNRDAMIAPAPDRAWSVPDTARYAATAAGRSGEPRSSGDDATGPPAIEPGKTYALAELIDIAQRTNPETRVAWERAREAALAVGIAEGAYAPMLSAQAVAAVQRAPLPLPKTVLTPQGFF